MPVKKKPAIITNEADLVPFGFKMLDIVRTPLGITGTVIGVKYENVEQKLGGRVWVRYENGSEAPLEPKLGAGVMSSLGYRRCSEAVHIQRDVDRHVAAQKALEEQKKVVAEIMYCKEMGLPVPEHLLPPPKKEKWAEQRMRLYGAQEKVFGRYFNLKFKKMEVEATDMSQWRWRTRKQLVMFFGNAAIGTRGGWGAKAVLQACHKVVERRRSGKPTDRLPGKVVTVYEFCKSRASSAVNSSQPCERRLKHSQPTRQAGSPSQVSCLLQSAWSQRFEAHVCGASCVGFG
ncbi:hypothetical protein QJQ45_018248 [Haematococcus lacustris]|nr:hypothetical protein QJQ45_018248 [Haematococcus lacustris]